jgi:hypothetical protein
MVIEENLSASAFSLSQYARNGFSPQSSPPFVLNLNVLALEVVAVRLLVG